MKRKKLITRALSASINITRINNHIEIIIDFDGKFDYYKLNYKGLTCHTAHGLTEPIKGNATEAIQQCEKLVNSFL